MGPTVKSKWCKGCGICVAYCPKKVLAIGKDGKAYVTDPSKCTGCKLCELRCPDLAISLDGGDVDDRQSQRSADAGE